MCYMEVEGYSDSSKINLTNSKKNWKGRGGGSEKEIIKALLSMDFMFIIENVSRISYSNVLLFGSSKKKTTLFYASYK